MNSVQQIRTAVANIQDELQRIVACADVRPIEQGQVTEDFKAKLITEFNTKLRGFKSKIRTLNEENTQLRERIAQLEGQLKGDPQDKVSRKTSLPPGPEMLPPKRQRIVPDEERVEIMSSPIKSDNREEPANRMGSRPDFTSSQLNRLPTQYSDSSETQKEAVSDVFATRRPLQTQESGSLRLQSPSRGPTLSSSPVKPIFIEEDDRIVADSQDEFEPLGPDKHMGHPSHYTALQRIELLRNYYRMKLNDSSYTVDLTTNPITEMPFVLADFKPNGNWSRPKHLHSHLGVMTKAQEQVYDQFFQEAGHGVQMAGPQWDGHKPQVAHDISLSDKENDNDAHASPENRQWVRSQVMDKYLSPPGYMVALFPTTQQQKEQKAAVAEKNQQRVARRVASALSNGEFIFYEEVLNTFVAQGRYTSKG